MASTSTVKASTMPTSTSTTSTTTTTSGYTKDWPLNYVIQHTIHAIMHKHDQYKWFERNMTLLVFIVVLALVLLAIIICLPLRETYIVLSSVHVRPSVRPSVCNATLVRAISPRTFVQKSP